MSQNHDSQVGSNRNEKFTADICVKIPTGKNDPGCHTGPDLTSGTSGFNKSKVSLPACECSHPCRRNLQDSDQRGSAYVCQYMICIAVIGLCLLLTILSLAGNYALWLKYEDLKTVQNDINLQLQECVDRYKAEEMVVSQEDQREGDLESDDVNGGLPGRPNFFQSPDESDFVSIDESMDSFSPARSRVKRDAAKKRKKNDKRKKKNRGRTNFEPSAFHLKGGSVSRVRGAKFVDWEVEWGPQTNTNYFYYSSGSVTVKKKGLYLVYSQVTYATTQEQISFSMYRKTLNEQEKLLTCISDMPRDVQKHSTCYSARAYYFQDNDEVFLSDNYAEHGSNVTGMVNFQPNLSFWGLIKLS